MLGPTSDGVILASLLSILCSWIISIQKCGLPSRFCLKLDLSIPDDFFPISDPDKGKATTRQNTSFASLLDWAEFCLVSPIERPTKSIFPRTWVRWRRKELSLLFEASPVSLSVRHEPLVGQEPMGNSLYKKDQVNRHCYLVIPFRLFSFLPVNVTDPFSVSFYSRGTCFSRVKHTIRL